MLRVQKGLTKTDLGTQHTELSAYNADLDTLFISMAIGFSIVSIIVGAAIKWMFSGNFSLFPWKS